jgi:hypothetical protein
MTGNLICNCTVPNGIHFCPPGGESSSNPKNLNCVKFRNISVTLLKSSHFRWKHERFLVKFGIFKKVVLSDEDEAIIEAESALLVPCWRQ